MRYTLSDLAMSDLSAIRHYVALDRPVAADQLIEKFFRQFELIANHPQIGALYENPLRIELRSLTVKNYVIYYLHSDAEIQIVRVLHGSRDVEAPLSESRDI